MTTLRSHVIGARKALAFPSILPTFSLLTFLYNHEEDLENSSTRRGDELARNGSSEYIAGNLQGDSPSVEDRQDGRELPLSREGSMTGTEGDWLDVTMAAQ